MDEGLTNRTSTLAQVLQSDYRNDGLHSPKIGISRVPGPFPLRPVHSSLTQKLTGNKVRGAQTTPTSTESRDLERGGDFQFSGSLPQDMTALNGQGLRSADDQASPRYSRFSKAEDYRYDLAGTERSKSDQPEGGSMRQILSGTSRERSASRSRKHVEKSIEATLTNAEMAKNVRSRKSSHYMGLFKDNSKTTEKKDEEKRAADQTRTGPLSPKSLSQRAAWLDDDRLVSPPGEEEVEERKASGRDDESEPHPEDEEEALTSIATKRPIIPASLLEEIRKDHQLSPVKSRIADTPAGGSSSRERTQQEEHSPSEQSVDKQIHDEEDDEEHISAAVYFPHAGHTQEEIDAFDDIELHRVQPTQVQDVGSHGLRTKPQLETRKSGGEQAPPEHVDIALQSKHEKSVFHGDYRPQSESGDDTDSKLSPIQEQASEGFSSASEYETDFTDDDSSLTQDEDTTPTATPSAPTKLHKHPKRLGTNGAPKNAVDLQPYSHQVGGHSTVFQFSRQAVCKKLNNRENEFYERIEQRHPDMLKFLPK